MGQTQLKKRISPISKRKSSSFDLLMMMIFTERGEKENPLGQR